MKQILEIPEVLKRPIKIKNGIILTNVKVDGNIKQFIVDSGAPSIILNHKYVKLYDLKQNTFRGVSGSGISHSTIIEKFEWGGLKISNQKALIINLSHLETTLKENIHGLIGYRQLSFFTFNIDYKNKLITLWRDFNKQKHIIKKEIPFALCNHLPAFEANIGNKKLNLALDTGASSNLLNINLKEALKKNFIIHKSSSMYGGDKNSQMVEEVFIDVLDINGLKCKNIKTVWSDISHLKLPGRELHGLVGYQLLKRHKFAISFPNSKIYILK